MSDCGEFSNQEDETGTNYNGNPDISQTPYDRDRILITLQLKSITQGLAIGESIMRNEKSYQTSEVAQC